MNQAIIKKALDEIASIDKEVATGLELIGYPTPRIRPVGFETFFSIIVSQQLSTHAAAAIMKRVREVLPDLAPQAVLDLPEGSLRTLGLSNRKAEYVEGLARSILSELNGSVSTENYSYSTLVLYHS